MIGCVCGRISEPLDCVLDLVRARSVGRAGRSPNVFNAKPAFGYSNNLHNSLLIWHDLGDRADCIYDSKEAGGELAACAQKRRAASMLCRRRFDIHRDVARSLLKRSGIRGVR